MSRTSCAVNVGELSSERVVIFHTNPKKGEKPMEILEKYGRLIAKAHDPRSTTENWQDCLQLIVITYVRNMGLSVMPIEVSAADEYGSPQYIEEARKAGWKPVFNDGQLLGFKKIEAM